MAHKHMKRCSTLLASREVQIKTTRYYFTPGRIAISKTDNASVGKDVEKLVPSSYTAARNGKWHSCFGKQSRGPSKVHSNIIQNSQKVENNPNVHHPIMDT